MLRSRKTERSIRKAVRQRLRPWPVLWKQYRTASKRKVEASLSLIILGALAVAMPACGAFCGNEGAILNAGGAIFMGVALAAIVIIAGKLHVELTTSRLLAVASVLPLPLTDIVRLGLKAQTSAMMVPLVSCVAFCVAFGMAAGLPPSGVIYSVCLGFVGWLTTVAAAITFVRFCTWIQTGDQLNGCGCIIIVLVIAIPFAAQAMFGAVPLILAWGTPAGWMALMLERAVLLGNPQFFLLLLPCALMVVVGLHHLMTLEKYFVIDELVLTHGGAAQRLTWPKSDGQIWPESERQPLPELTPIGNGVLLEVDEESGEPPSTPVPVPAGYSYEFDEEPELHPDQARERVRSELTPHDWSDSSFTGRFLYSLLSSDEKVIAQCWVDRSRNDGQSWVVQVYILFAVLTVICGVVDLLLGDDGFNDVPYFGVLVIILYWTSGWSQSVWRSGNQTRCPSTILMPIRSSALQSYMLKVAMVQLPVVFPLAFFTALYAVVGREGFPNAGPALIMAGKMCLYLIAIYQWAFVSVQPHEINMRSVAKGDDILLLGLMLLAGASGVALFFVGAERLYSLIASFALLGFGWIAQKLFLRRVLKHAADFVTPTTSS